KSGKPDQSCSAASCLRFGSTIVLCAVHRSDETIAVTWQSFDEMRTLGVVVQRRPQALHGVVKALLEVHKRVRCPQLLLQLFTGNDLARPFEQYHEDLHRLAFQPDLHALFAEFPSSGIELECTKTKGGRN